MHQYRMKKNGAKNLLSSFTSGSSQIHFASDSLYRKDIFFSKSELNYDMRYVLREQKQGNASNI